MCYHPGRRRHPGRRLFTRYGTDRSPAAKRTHTSGVGAFVLVVVVGRDVRRLTSLPLLSSRGNQRPNGCEGWRRGEVVLEGYPVVVAVVRQSTSTHTHTLTTGSTQVQGYMAPVGERIYCTDDQSGIRILRFGGELSDRVRFRKRLFIFSIRWKSGWRSGWR